MDALTCYGWPGNIRELENVIARAVILSQTEVIEPATLSLDSGGDSPREELTYISLPYHQSMEQHSRHIIDRALKYADGNQTKAAERLQLQRTYLARLIKQQRMKQDGCAP
jgi:DNA-binding NtrC family response regulator